MATYQLLRTYLESMFGNVYQRARTDERGMTAEAIIVTAAAIVGALAVTLILWQKLKTGANNVTVPRTRRPVTNGTGMRLMRRMWRDERGVAATIVVFPLFAVVTFMFIQALLWQHDRQLADAAADRVSSAVALYGSDPGAARSDATAELTAAGMHHITVTIISTVDTTVVDIAGETPGILIGTSATVHAHSVTPTQGYRTP